jgi:hypothetical protein
VTRQPLCEYRVFSRRHRFAGTLDVLGIWHGAGACLDYKTGHPKDVATDLQTSAYVGALAEMQATGETSDALVFDEATHTYTLDGERLPSVTQILQRAGAIDFSHIPPTILEAARERGTAVHKAVHYFNENDLDVDVFRVAFPDYWPYVSAWIKFLDTSGFRFATVDTIGSTSHVRRYAVALKKDGSFVVEPYRNPNDYSEFLALRRAQAIVDRRRPTDYDFAGAA